MRNLTLSLIAVSLILNSYICAEEPDADGIQTEKATGESEIEIQQRPLRVAFSKKNEDEQSTPPKKVKPHFAGVRRQEPKEGKADGEKKKSSRVKNQWVSSKTHPKTKKKARPVEEVEIVQDLPEERPYFRRADHRYSTSLLAQNNGSGIPPSEQGNLERKVDEVNDYREGVRYPYLGFEAPKASLYLTGEWLYWRVRQEGMEFVPGKKVHFDFDSGFRTGIGVHLPHDGWDLYVNYTRYATSQTDGAHGPIFPLMLYAATNLVDQAHIHWKFLFQTADLEIGRIFNLSKTLIVRPFFGVKGAWIDQRVRLRYEGGMIPSGESYRAHLQNDFRGGGPLLGIHTHWDLGVGLSFFGNGSVALVIGEFNNEHKQTQIAGFEPINLNANLRLVTSALQLVTGLAWNRNFCADRCHFGISAGFEAQYWTNQNQMEQFTTPAQPYFVRNNGDLALYGLTLRARFDF